MNETNSSLENLTVNSSNKLQQLRAIWVLENIGSPEAIQLLEKLATGTPQARQTLEAQRALSNIKLKK